ncbi:MAG: S46 family peptidase, partial [Bacteroidota bacterium]
MRNIAFVLGLSLTLSLLPLQLMAGEGMWLPLLLASLNEADMQAAGLELSAEDIYSVNQSSLKDAVGLFGGGCTGSIISDKGLYLTNHHCGLSYLQRQSTLENNYLENGYWATNQEEELSNEGLTATFLVRMESVTDQILAGVTRETTEQERAALVAKRSLEIQQANAGEYQARVVSFFQGNEYYLLLTQTYRDVRLVAAPPKAIGKFGGEIDNWVWPRHNADFMLFRIYTGPDGKPAPYAEENVPLKPKHFLPVSLEGVKEGDFTMVMGFPGTTEENLPSSGLAITQELRDPLRVNLRAARLDIIEEVMEREPETRLTFASKKSGVANAYKKWRGRILGLRKNDAIQIKEAREEEFQARVNASPEWKAAYGDLLSTFNDLYQETGPARLVTDYFIEGGYTLEFVRFAAGMSNLFQDYPEGEGAEQEKIIAEAKDRTERFFANYRADMDQALLQAVV